MIGKIHSIESLGTVDGPGIRSVVFFQGCALRCRYCHNPDTWLQSEGIEIDSEEVVKKVLRFNSYFGSEGGVTLSGGEPMLQPEFAATILKGCKEYGLHTVVDTSGWVDISALQQVLPYTDLLLLDVKALSGKEYQWLTGKKEDKFRKALTWIKKQKQDLWLRYVVLPGINDGESQVEQLRELVADLSPCIRRVELLPYHTLGVHKWERLGLNYSLGELPPPSEDQIKQMHELLFMAK